MVSPQNHDTRGGPPPPPPSDVTAATALCTKLENSPEGCFCSLDRYIKAYFANLNIKNT